MALESNISDPGNGRVARVVIGGALAVAPIHPSLSFNGELATDDVVVNIVPAKAGHVFRMTGLLLTGNKNIDTTTAATVNVFTGDADDSILADALTVLFTMPVAKNSTRDITPILVEAEEGKYINAVTSDDDIFVTILGYYLKVEM
jgi:hypothetical protein